ncbi:MAG TPA: hypothetical protein VFI52_18075 [Gemmatimonadaceae bacterium]|nr:hypothetical protein [Gemmatimonadaceae bacterium]
MLHLSTDRLAALADEQPTSAEAAHLATCEACARERDAYLTLVAMAQAERSALGLPLTRWDSIAAALDPAASTPVRRVARISTRWPLQAAAGLLLMAGGAMLGRASVGADVIPGDTARVATATSAPVHKATAASDSVFRSIDEARAAQRRSEQLYQQAVAYLARYDSSAVDDGSPVAYKSRLAALDRVISATSEAMREAPHDPVINGYYLTTLGQREATIRQLNTALPQSLRLDSF